MRHQHDGFCFAPERLPFIDETSVKTNMAKTTGWAPQGQRLIDHTPFQYWGKPPDLEYCPS